MTKVFTRIIIATLFAAIFVPFGLAQDSDTIYVRYRGDVGRLDPIDMSSLHDYGVADNIYSQLVRFIPGTSEIEADLATSWEVSEDGLTYTFHLREGVQFHRGFGELTASDVKWSYDRLIGPESTSPGRFAFAPVASVEAVDDYTVRFHLHAPHSPLIGKLAYPRWTGVVNQTAREQFGDQYNFNAIGTGPFMLESWTPGDRIVLGANPDYFEEGLPATQRIVLIPISDDTVAAGALETGELAFGHFLNPEVIKRLEANPNLVVDRGPQSSISALYYRLDRAPFNDPLVVQALHHAIDRTGIVESVVSGVANPAYSIVTPLAPGATTDVSVLEYDPILARQLLAESSYDPGRPLVFLSTQLEPWPLVAPLLAFYLEEAGFNIDFRQLEHGTYGSEGGAGNYDLVVLSITGPADPDTFVSLVHSSNTPPGNNRSYYSNPDVDALIDLATATVDPDARADLYEEIQRQVALDRALYPIFHLGVQIVRHANIKDFTIPIALDFALETVRWEP